MKRIGVLFLSVILFCSSMAYAGPNDVKKYYKELTSRYDDVFNVDQLWDIYLYLRDKLGIADKHYVAKNGNALYPECENIKDYMPSPYGTQKDVPIEQQILLLRMFNNCLLRYIWIKETDVMAINFGVFGHGPNYGRWPEGYIRELKSEFPKEPGAINIVQWWDQYNFNDPKCRGELVPNNMKDGESKREFKKRIQEVRDYIVEKNCFFPRGYQEYRTHDRFSSDKEVKTIIYDDVQAGKRYIGRYSLVQDPETGFYGLDYWELAYDYNQYYQWLNQKQQDIVDGMYPVTIDATMVCDSQTDCLEKIKLNNPAATDLEKYKSMLSLPIGRLRKIDPFASVDKK